MFHSAFYTIIAHHQKQHGFLVQETFSFLLPFCKCHHCSNQVHVFSTWSTMVTSTLWEMVGETTLCSYQCEVKTKSCVNKQLSNLSGEENPHRCWTCQGKEGEATFILRIQISQPLCASCLAVSSERQARSFPNVLFGWWASLSNQVVDLGWFTSVPFIREVGIFVLCKWYYSTWRQ